MSGPPFLASSSRQLENLFSLSLEYTFTQSNARVGNQISAMMPKTEYSLEIILVT